MLSCPKHLFFSETLRLKRLRHACALLGEPVVRRLLAYSFFLMGGNREEIARWLNMPVGTFFSFLTRVDQHQLDAFADRRKREQTAQAPVSPSSPLVRFHSQGEHLFIECGGTSIRMPRNDALGCKLLVLRSLESELLTAQEAAELLGYSRRHIGNLLESLSKGGAAALLDQRQGQQQDYRFGEKVKAELVQQFVANVICNEPVSSEHLAGQIHERCEIELAPRSIRHHVKKLGLRRIVHSLPQMVGKVKKTPYTFGQTDC